MSRIRSIVPILHITKELNPYNLSQTLKKIHKFTKFQIAGVGIVVDIPNCSPVTTDIMSQSLKMFRQTYNVPILGFTYQHVTLQSYYLLSLSDRIYTYPSSIYKLRPDKVQISMDNLFKKMNLKKTYNISNYKLLRRLLDMFSIRFEEDNNFEIPSYQNVDIGERIFNEAMKNRKQFCNITGNRNNYYLLKPEKAGILNQIQENQLQIKDITNQGQLLFQKLNYNSIQSVIMGQQALKYNLVDGYGAYEEILEKHFPNSIIWKANYQAQNKSITKIVFFISSPIILIVFLIKVAVKWTIIFYAWLKAKTIKMAGIQPNEIQNEGYQTDGSH